jgi:hypothetical protein
MQPRLLITDNGKHPPEKWAMFTVEGLLEIDANSPNATAGLRLKADMVDVLSRSFDAVMVTERAALAGDSNARYAASLTPEIDSVDEAVDALIKCADGTPFETFYREPGKRDAVKGVVAHHFALAIDIERSTHADQNPSDGAKDYQEARREKGMHQAHHHLHHLRKDGEAVEAKPRAPRHAKV